MSGDALTESMPLSVPAYCLPSPGTTADDLGDRDRHRWAMPASCLRLQGRPVQCLGGLSWARVIVTSPIIAGVAAMIGTYAAYRFSRRAKEGPGHDFRRSRAPV